MATLERRVQVLFDPEHYAALEDEARATGVSVGAFVREAVRQKLEQKYSRARAELEAMFARADATPIVDDTPIEEMLRQYAEDFGRAPLP